MHKGYSNVRQHTPRQIMKMIRLHVCLHTPSGQRAAVKANIHVPGVNLLSSLQSLCQGSRNYVIY